MANNKKKRCNLCQAFPIVGIRYHCRDCADYNKSSKANAFNLCERCFFSAKATSPSITHLRHLPGRHRFQKVYHPQLLQMEKEWHTPNPLHNIFFGEQRERRSPLLCKGDGLHEGIPSSKKSRQASIEEEEASVEEDELPTEFGKRSKGRRSRRNDNNKKKARRW